MARGRMEQRKKQRDKVSLASIISSSLHDEDDSAKNHAILHTARSLPSLPVSFPSSPTPPRNPHPFSSSLDSRTSPLNSRVLNFKGTVKLGVDSKKRRRSNILALLEDAQKLLTGEHQAIEKEDKERSARPNNSQERGDMRSD